MQIRVNRLHANADNKILYVQNFEFIFGQEQNVDIVDTDTDLLWIFLF